MSKENFLSVLIFSPERFFEDLESRKITVKDVIISFVIVISSSLSNIASALYLHKAVTYKFSLYTISVSVIAWIVFSLILFSLSKLFSSMSQGFLKILYGLGISRIPLIIFVGIQFLSLLGKYRINETSMPFLMIYIIAVLWMFYLYITCMEKLLDISAIKSVFLVITTFIVVLILATSVNSALNIRAIYF